MKKNIGFIIVFCLLLLALAPTAGAVEYQELPRVDIEQYQAAPKVQVLFESDTIQEIPAEYVLQKDGKVYLAAALLVLYRTWLRLNNWTVSRSLLSRHWVGILYRSIAKSGSREK